MILNNYVIGEKMNKTNSTDLQIYTTFTAAKKLLVTPPTIIKWIKEGHLKTIKTPGGHRRIPAEEINRVWNEMNIEFNKGKEKNELH